MKIAMTSVPVIDPIAAFKFYTETLGFVEKLYMPELYLAIVASPEDKDGTTLLLEPRGNFGSDKYYEGIYNAGLPVIVFGTEDVQAEYERLKALGVVFKQEPTKTNGERRRYSTTPAGILYRSISPEFLVPVRSSRFSRLFSTQKPTKVGTPNLCVLCGFA